MNQTKRAMKEKYESKVKAATQQVEEMTAKLAQYEETFLNERSNDALIMKAVQTKLEELLKENFSLASKVNEQEKQVISLERVNASNLQVISELRQELRGHGTIEADLKVTLDKENTDENNLKVEDLSPTGTGLLKEFDKTEKTEDILDS